jgi:4-alpha-glucanotransferase
MRFNRSSGILLHITSLPNDYGIGSLGKEAVAFIDFLSKSNQKLWQIFPTGPTGYGDSPYQTFSAFAGNPLFIDVEELIKEGLLNPEDCEIDVPYPKDKVDFGRIFKEKNGWLRKAFSNFKENDAFHEFCKEEAVWLDDFALFIALKENFGGKSWVEWDENAKTRDKETLENFRAALSEEIQYQKFLQFKFFQQWEKVHQYAKEKNISIIGDIPIFIGLDSADAWANPHLFHFDENCNPTFIAGVPPDGFSPTGQLWGNPLYNWEAMEQNHFQWWIQRFSAMLKIVDIIRVDHFIGFVNYWAVPAGEKTAEKGSWEPGPGRKVFDAVEKSLGKLPIIAEDLGVITPPVVELRDLFSFPGMKILQFAFYDGLESDFLPHHYTENFVVYTGTHDNETTRGWYKNIPENVREFADKYLDFDGDKSTISWKLIITAWESKADMAIVPMQDILNLDNSARMNLPGTSTGNWQWRMKKTALNDEISRKLKAITLKNRR